MDELCMHGRESSKDRSRRACASKTFDSIRDKVLFETTSEDLLRVLHAGGTATNNYLRRLHNLALNLGWLPWAILVKNAWPKLRYKERRAITLEEHRLLVESECSAERRLFYELLWESGGSQSDIANLTAENVDWATSSRPGNRRTFRRFNRSFPVILEADYRPNQAPVCPGTGTILNKFY
ncbi:MAG TPA: hypothetical protein VIT91_03795 [Chthoniobacterales bacterium]